MSKQTKAMSTTLSDGTEVRIDRLGLTRGVAGMVEAHAKVTHTYDDGTSDTSVWTLAGSAFGGPVVALLGNGAQVFVRDAERFGSFSADPREYLRRYVLNER